MAGDIALFIHVVFHMRLLYSTLFSNPFELSTFPASFPPLSDCNGGFYILRCLGVSASLGDCSSLAVCESTLLGPMAPGNSP